VEPYGITIFSDDLRHELHGKITLVGMYGGELLLYTELPTLLPKLCILVQARLPLSEFKSLKILVYVPWLDDKEPLLSQDIFPLFATAQPLPVGAPEAELQILSINYPIVFSPFLIQSEGLIKVRIEADDKIIKAGTLKITRRDPPENKTT
jgi:hypothetical protein